jgi:hypothetical protein
MRFRCALRLPGTAAQAALQRELMAMIGRFNATARRWYRAKYLEIVITRH